MSKSKEVINLATLKIFVILTRKKAREAIKQKSKTLKRKLERHEKREIIEKVAKTTRGRAMLLSAFSLGAIGGVGGTIALNEARTPDIKKNISIDYSSIKINNVEENNRDIFINGIKVDFKEITYIEKIEREAKDEVYNLETSDNVLKYIKSIYKEEYNEKYNANISNDDISIYKTRQTPLLTDKAEKIIHEKMCHCVCMQK